MLKAVIFDMDGVLVDSEPLHYEINKLTAERYCGIILDDEYYKQYIGTTVFSMWEKIKKDFGFDGFSAQELFDLSEGIKEELVSVNGYPEVKGAVSFVKSLVGKFKLAVASSSSLVNIEKNMKTLGLLEEKILDEDSLFAGEDLLNEGGSFDYKNSLRKVTIFDKLVSGTTVANPKPAPDVFLKAALELGVEPNECIVIEDSSNGAKAAKAAGMACVGFLNPSSGEQDLSMADYLFEEFDGIDGAFLEMVHAHYFGEPWRVFETDRLVIREMCPDDVEAIYKIYEGNDLRYTENLFEDIDKEREYIKDYQEYIYNFYDFGIWLFEEKSTGDIIGRGGVEQKIYEDGTEAIELGYIVRKDKQKQGYAYEGLRAILTYIKEHFDIKSVRVSIHKDNVSSVELAKKLGAVFEDESEDNSILAITQREDSEKICNEGYIRGIIYL